MTKRGQAAMEFLMTYGWAILAAIIAIGVLAYFGVFSPGKYIPSATVVNPPFNAVGSNVDVSDLGVNIELRNNGGEKLTITSVAITPTDWEDGGCTADTTPTPGNVDAGDTSVALVLCSGADFIAGNNFKGDITITYTKAGSTIFLTSTGTISDTIVA